MNIEQVAAELHMIRAAIGEMEAATAELMRTVTVNYTREQIAAKCRQWGPQVTHLPPGVDGTTLLWGMSGNESGFGVNCTPRHEPAYDTGGRYSHGAPLPGLLENFGSAAACSYGPWQVMFCNLPLGTTPAQAQNDLDLMAQESVIFLNSLLRHWNPANLDEIGECWNAGHVTPDPDYTTKLQRNYAVPMPPVPAQ